MEEHFATCAACREEIAALRAVRSDLQRWKAPPARPIPFRRAAFGRRPSWPRRPRCVLAAWPPSACGAPSCATRRAASASRLGRAEPLAARGPGRTGEAPPRGDEGGPRRARLVPAPGESGAASPRHGSPRLLRESEARQAQKLEAELSGLAERTETRRRYDLARDGAGLAYIDGKNGQQLSRTAELMGHVLDASQKRDER